MRIGLILVMLVMAGSALASDDPVFDREMAETKALCADLLPGEYRLQETCVVQQLEGRVAIADLGIKYDRASEEWRILELCLRKTKDSKGRYDWHLAHVCATQELSAYQRLRE